MRVVVAAIACSALALGAAGGAGAARLGTVLASPDFPAGGTIPAAFTCDGKGSRPALTWTGLPEGTASVAIEVVDPDAPLPGGFTHWLAWGISAGKGRAGALAGVAPVPYEGAGTTGRTGWVGPCPPTGTHRYVFTLVALRAPLALAAGADRATFEKAVAAARPLGRATLIGRYAHPGTAGSGAAKAATTTTSANGKSTGAKAGTTVSTMDDDD